MTTKPLVLVDGSSYLYRAFHALPALKNSKNFPTGAVYGVINMLKKLMSDYPTEQIAVIFDAKGKTFRDDIYADYKATRSEMPSDLVLQIEPIHDIIRALGLPLLMIEGVEADDVIGTLATIATKQKIEVIVSTGDKDLAQLVNEHVTLINTMTNTLMNPQGVVDKFGVPPERIVDYLTLVGDTSDNVPGVPQVGPKTAAKWLQAYESLDNIIANADKISGKVGENLRQFIPQIPLTKSLVTIKRDLDLPISLADIKIQKADEQTLIKFYKEMEFKSWLSELLAKSTHQAESEKVDYSIIHNKDTLMRWVEVMNRGTVCAISLKTTNFDYMTSSLVGIGLSNQANAVYIPIAHHSDESQLEKNTVLALLKPIFENPQIQKIGHNMKYVIEILAKENIQLQNIAFDTMLESYVLDSNSNSHDIETLSLKYLGKRAINYEEIAGKGSKQISFDDIAIDTAGNYSAEEADVTLQLHRALWPRITKEPGIQYVFEEIELPLVSVLARMERHGVLIDPDKLVQQGKELKQRAHELEQEAFIFAQEEFNINSPKQLQEILFTKLKLPVLQKTPTGQASTADAVLQELALDFALPKVIIELRSINKLISTYTSRLIEQIQPLTGRVHTSYNQTVTTTGRLSSTEPNLQNIPIRSKEGRRIRQAFIAAPGCKLISADYSQIELRIMAHMSEDPSLLYAFANNLDIHTATAAEVLGIPLDQVTQDMRREAKAVNFGLIYGMSAFGLSKQLGIDRKKAQAYIERYFARYPNVKAYMEKTRESAKEKEYVETIWGRRLYVPDINASQIPRQKAAERAAINAPLQGSAADIIKLAMIRIDKWIREKNIPGKMIMQVHDELVFEVEEEAVAEVAEAIRAHMAEVVQLQVPLVVAVGSGDNWDASSAH